MFRVLAIIAAIAGFLLPSTVLAQGNSGAGDIFTVARVPVQATAPSAERARLIAQDRGRAQAFQILLQRLTPSEDWPYLPRPPLSELLNMQVGFEVENERFSTAAEENLYIADITYAFRRDHVRPLLRSEGIAFSESQAAAVLVLPVFDRGNQRMLWEADNPWAAAWEDTDLSHELVPFFLPRGDLADLTTVPVNDVVAGNWDALEFLANRYGVEHIIVAHGVLLEEDDGTTFYARLTELSANGSGQVRDTQISGTATVDDLTGAVDLGDMGPRAISILSGRFQQNWKTQTLVSYDVQHRLQATAFFGGLTDWVHIRDAFEDSATVTEYDAHALSSNGAEVAVSFVGTTEQLMITLDQRGVTLSGDRGYWDIRLRGTSFESASGYSGDGKNGEYYGNGSMPPVETIVMRDEVQQNAPILTGEDLNILFQSPLTPEEIEERRRQGLGDQPGTMQPVPD